MSANPALPVAFPERVGNQMWAESITGPATPERGLNLRLALVAATIACGLVAGVLMSRLLG